SDPRTKQPLALRTPAVGTTCTLFAFIEGVESVAPNEAGIIGGAEILSPKHRLVVQLGAVVTDVQAANGKGERFEVEVPPVIGMDGYEPIRTDHGRDLKTIASPDDRRRERAHRVVADDTHRAEEEIGCRRGRERFPIPIDLPEGIDDVTLHLEVVAVPDESPAYLNPACRGEGVSADGADLIDEDPVSLLLDDPDDISRPGVLLKVHVASAQQERDVAGGKPVVEPVFLVQVRHLAADVLDGAVGLRDDGE